ncbi:hypothetical protein CDS [Bradyrhizobium sp.]|nr:hypothetical protein CDS [Bradyrhizobium sp.]
MRQRQALNAGGGHITLSLPGTHVLRLPRRGWPGQARP